MKYTIKNLNHHVLSNGAGVPAVFLATGDGGKLRVCMHSPLIISVEYIFDGIETERVLLNASEYLTLPLKTNAGTIMLSVNLMEDSDNYTIDVNEIGGEESDSIATHVVIAKETGTVAIYREGILLHGGQMGTGDTVIPAYPLRCITERENSLPLGRFNFPLAEGDSFYGLGDKSGLPNRRGRCFKMFNRDALGYDAKNSDPLYKSVPFFIKWNRKRKALCGLFFPEALIGDIDFGRESPYYFNLEVNGGPFIYYALLGCDYRQVMDRYCRVNGYPTLPPLFSFGFLGSSMNYVETDDAAQRILDYFDTIEEHAIPCEGMYVSSGYLKAADGKRYAFLWNKKKFPNYDIYLKSLAERGYNLCMNIKPGILTSHPWYGEVAQKKYLIADAQGNPYVEFFWGGEASFIDFENPKAKSWWKSQLKEQYIDHGCTGIWNDNNELELEDHALPAFKTKSLYPVRMAEASYEAFKESSPALRPWIYSRSGYAGLQRYARTWTGDNVSDWQTLRYNQYMGISLGLAAMPFYGHDLGGFFGAFPEEELLVRSCQSAVFQSRFVIHSWREDGRPTEPWSYPDSLGAIRHFIREHYRFMPYTYNCSIEASRTGTPLDRPLFLEFPDDAGIDDRDSNTLFGPSILKVLAVEPGVQSVSVRLPGTLWWYASHDGKLYRGGSVLDVSMPLNEIRWFAKEGSIIPTSPALSQLTTGIFPVLDFLVFPPLDKQTAEYRYIEDDGKTELSLDRWNEWLVTVIYDSASGNGSVTLRCIKEGLPHDGEKRIFRCTLPAHFTFDMQSLGSAELHVEGSCNDAGASWNFSGRYDSA